MASGKWNGRLMDGEEQAKRFPTSFEIPSHRERCSLGPPDVVKLGFLLDEKDADGFEGERMWVKIIGSSYNKNADGSIDESSVLYTGILLNVPAYLDMDAFASKNGYCVTFEPKHILDAQRQN